MLFLDVSSYQGTIDFKRAKQGNHLLTGVWIKATEGLDYTNPYAYAQAVRARKAGLRVGFYAFARPDRNQDATAEAQHFVEAIAPLTTRRDLKPVLDMETWSIHMGPDQHVAWAREFCQAVHKKVGLLPLFYSYAPFIDRMNPDRPIGNGLWLASYGRNDGRAYPFKVPAPWRRVVAHQFSSRAHIAGCPGYVDLSVAPRLLPLLAHPVKGRL